MKRAEKQNVKIDNFFQIQKFHEDLVNLVEQFRDIFKI